MLRQLNCTTQDQPRWRGGDRRRAQASSPCSALASKRARTTNLQAWMLGGLGPAAAGIHDHAGFVIGSPQIAVQGNVSSARDGPCAGHTAWLVAVRQAAPAEACLRFPLVLLSISEMRGTSGRPGLRGCMGLHGICMLIPALPQHASSAERDLAGGAVKSIACTHCHLSSVQTLPNIFCV